MNCAMINSDTLYKNLMTAILPRVSESYSKPCSYDAACIALAKDEAPYLHEYIHHHLFFGFKRILILPNRNTDTTLEMIDSIAALYPEVTMIEVDWVDEIKLPQCIQRLGYAQAINLLRQENSVRYALMTDIDEFWYPTNFETSIKDYLPRRYPIITKSSRFPSVGQCSRQKTKSHLSLHSKIKGFM